MDAVFNLSQNFADEMIAQARAEAPDECCGILAGLHGTALKLYRATNAEHSPDRYNIDPDELIEIYREIQERDWQIVAIYHSHTHSAAYPSTTDVKYAFWPESVYLILSPGAADGPLIRAFRITGGNITEIEMKITRTG